MKSKIELAPYFCPYCDGKIIKDLSIHSIGLKRYECENGHFIVYVKKPK